MTSELEGHVADTWRRREFEVGAAPSTSLGLADDLAERLRPQALPGASEQRWRKAFPGEEWQLSAIRRWLTSLLPECPARDDVILVATELATNAVLHTKSGRGGLFDVEITWSEQVVRVAVADSGSPDSPRAVADPSGEHGRGLLVVAALSTRTGTYLDHGSRVVWADILWA